MEEDSFNFIALDLGSEPVLSKFIASHGGFVPP